MNAKFYLEQGNTLYNASRYAEAVLAYRQAIACDPSYTDAHRNLGVALEELGQYEAAAASYGNALALHPNYAEVHYSLGNIFHKLQRYEDARAAYAKAIALKANYAQAHYNYGVTLEALRRPIEALAAYNAAIALNPAYVEAYNNRGTLFQTLGEYVRAMEDYNHSIAIDPHFALAQFNKGLLKLLLGEFKEGWQLHEWRWLRPGHKKARDFVQPLWLGKESLTGKTILLHVEQGLGDTIQLCRYVPMVEALGAKVILEVPAPLVELMSTLKSHPSIVAKDSALPHFDLHCPLMSLPLALGTLKDTIPADIPYLAASPEKRVAWQKKLGPKTRPRIGLTWSGTALHKNDRNRSIALNLLEPLWQLDADYHSLQKEIKPEDEAALAKSPIATYEQQLQDFSDTAALITEMDMVVSVDTSVAHLAGALGKNVWIMLPFSPDFRWLLHRRDTPWYPTAKLFRQTKSGDWTSVIARVKKDLGEVF